MTEKILLVDDDSNILEGYQRSLRGEFQLETALGGPEALKLAAASGPYAVVVSDMRMPGMDGIQLLTSVKTRWPDTIRVMLTGNADVQTAIDAINEGNIFRFLNKPCNKEAMGKTLTAALVQFRLVTAEKVLLEQTLTGAVQVLTEVLSLVNPAAFGCAERARRYIHHVVTTMRLGNPWQYEVAAMMSQLGCVTLPAETIQSVYAGQKLAEGEQVLYDAHSRVAYDLLSKIPRLEPIARMIRHQSEPMPDTARGDSQKSDIRQGAEMLRLILAYDKLIQKGMSRTEAAHSLSRQTQDLSPAFFEALVQLDPNAEEGEVRKCKVQDLIPGMIVQQDIRTPDKTLLVSKGQEVTAPLLMKLRNLQLHRAIIPEIAISEPATTLAFARGAAQAAAGPDSSRSKS